MSILIHRSYTVVKSNSIYKINLAKTAPVSQSCSPLFRASLSYYSVENTCGGVAISARVVVPTKKGTPRSRYEESTLQQPLFGEYTTSTEPENPKRLKKKSKKKKNDAILKSLICWGKNASDKDRRSLLP